MQYTRQLVLALFLSGTDALRIRQETSVAEPSTLEEAAAIEPVSAAPEAIPEAVSGSMELEDVAAEGSESYLGGR